MEYLMSDHIQIPRHLTITAQLFTQPKSKPVASLDEWLRDNLPNAIYTEAAAVVGLGLRAKVFQAIFISGISEADRILLKLRWGF
jgi:hypothetical protein